MFKYQHVADWYIVACPRAACPFDTEAQALNYPERYSLAMLLLAEELQAITRQRFSHHDGRSIWLKVALITFRVIAVRNVFHKCRPQNLPKLTK